MSPYVRFWAYLFALAAALFCVLLIVYLPSGGLVHAVA